VTNFVALCGSLRISAISVFDGAIERRDRRDTQRTQSKPAFKSGRTQSFLTGSTFRGEALKERSEG